MEQSLKHLRLPLAALAVLVMSACGKAPETAGSMPPAKVSVAKVLEQPVNEWDEFTGRLEAPETVEIRPRVSGQIDEVAFSEGALVKKGDLLFQIDPRPFQAEVRRLEALVAQGRANATRSENEAQRGERLRTSNAISAELADSRTSAAQEARAAVGAIQAQLDLAKLNLSFTRVTAPISGRVSRAEITAGNLVTADVTALTSVVSTDKVYAYFDADERVFLKYSQLARQGQRLFVQWRGDHAAHHAVARQAHRMAHTGGRGLPSAGVHLPGGQRWHIGGQARRRTDRHGVVRQAWQGLGPRHGHHLQLRGAPRRHLGHPLGAAQHQGLARSGLCGPPAGNQLWADATGIAHREGQQGRRRRHR